jgi:hypothetical protein
MKHLREPLFSLSTGGTANVTRTFPHRLKVIAPLVLLLAVWCISSPRAFAASSIPKAVVLPPAGGNYGVLSNSWWQWALSIPPASNPVIDTTGEHCGVGQSGSIWFLAGVFGTGSATRDDCTVPAGKRLFIPIWNIVNVAINADCSHSTDTVDSLRAGTTPVTDAQDPTTYQVQVDGESIPILLAYRAGPNNPSFNFIHLSVATVNVAFGLNCADGALNSPPYLAVSDGYYLMLAPLTPGRHIIHFEVPNSQNITYHLTVKS